ncbi:MAG: hypothetical protein Ta2D_13860 [Rickettsiales bacterium]|nr:MAG: hypothetical protein Ta2D_13860 [Rickettsiales bacterium]
MNETLLKIISESYKVFFAPTKKDNSRSSDKLKSIHSFIANTIKEKLDKNYKIYSISENKEDKEKIVAGFYYNKKVDITINYKKKDIVGIGVKSIMGNYSQNSNNYFENLLGETANLQRNKFKYCNFLIIPKYVPHYKKGATKNTKKLSKIEELNDMELKKYLKLYDDNLNNIFHKPNLTFILVIDTGIKDVLQNNLGKELNIKEFNKVLLKNYKITIFDIKNCPELRETKNFLEKVNDFDKFIDAVYNLVKVLSYGE